MRPRRRRARAARAASALEAGPMLPAGALPDHRPSQGPAPALRACPDRRSAGAGLAGPAPGAYVTVTVVPIPCLRQPGTVAVALAG